MVHEFQFVTVCHYIGSTGALRAKILSKPLLYAMLVFANHLPFLALNSQFGQVAAAITTKLSGLVYKPSIERATWNMALAPSQKKQSMMWVAQLNGITERKRVRNQERDTIVNTSNSASLEQLLRIS